MTCKTMKFMEFEKELSHRVLVLGKLFVLLFLTMRDEYLNSVNTIDTETYTKQGPNSRILGTLFGKIRYWRTYLYNTQASGGYYPLDLALGLPLDGFSMMVRSYAAQVATKMSYAQSVAMLALFLQWSPCQKTVEEMVLGLGRFTGEWFATAPPPEDDGEVLIIQIDSKATPTATDEELAKRRGKRIPSTPRGSQRHRGRAQRKRRGARKRRKKGDKSKNGKMATIVVLYTLKRNEDGQLEGPINKKVYASYAPKRHAVAIARREADKRGFGSDRGRVVQIVTDGDEDLARYIEELFPEAIHTIDIFHVLEYLWEAGRCLYQEGSDELLQWVEEQKDALYGGRIAEIIKTIDQHLALLPTRGPGMKSRRERLEKVRNYLSKRTDKMDYHTLLDQDLEIGSGAVEGAVKYVIAQRFDSSGMRWIKGRAEALLQLRCIEVNDDWDAFIASVHDQTISEAQETKTNLFLKSKEAAPLPTYGLH
jgi:hypothetical protein